MALFKKVFKAFALPFVSLNKALVKPLFGLLTPKVPKLGGGGSAEQMQDPTAQNNAARLGDPQTVLYGLNSKYYPTLSQTPWFEYVGNQQVLHMRMRVSVGICTVNVLEIGDTPFNSFSGSRYELCPPGQPMTLFHPNVYTAENLNGVDLVAGVFQSRSYTGELVFSGNRISVPMDSASVAARAAAGINPFEGVVNPNDAVVSGTMFNDGIWEVVTFDSSDPQDWIDTEHTFVDETVTATVSYGAYYIKGSSAPTAQDADVTFNSALSTIYAAPRPPPFDDDQRPLSGFLPGDVITNYRSGAGANEYAPFTVVEVDFDGALVVTPPPFDQVGVVDVYLLRRYHGPFPVCAPGDIIDRVGFDLLWPIGIGSKGGTKAITMRFDAQYQRIDDAGTPLSGWLSFPELVVTWASKQAIRRSFERTLDVPGRYQVRLAQNSTDSSDNAVLDTVQWMGARGYVVARPGETPEIDRDSTTLMISLVGNNAALSGSNQKVRVETQRWLEPYDAEARAWLPEVPTNSAALASLDKLRGRYTARGRQWPDAQIDIPAFLALDETGAEFHGGFSVAANLRDNVNTILRLARAKLSYRPRSNKLSVYHDAPAAPRQLFADGLNAEVSGYSVKKRTANDPTGMQMLYFDPGRGQDGEVSIGDTDNKPLKLDLRNGCRDRQVAWEELNYEWAKRYRVRPVTVRAELEPLVLDFGDPIMVQSRKRKWGQCAFVTAADGRELSVWPPLDWAGTGFSVWLRDPYGRPGANIACTRNGADDQLLLAADPDVELTNDAGGEQRTILVFASSAGGSPVIALVDEIGWAGNDGPGQTATINATLDDARVHADPGPAPVDPRAPVIVRPNLDVSPLTLSESAGTVTAVWSDVFAAIYYSVEWRYAGALSWLLVRRTTLSTAAFDVPVGGSIEVRVRAIGEGGAIGPYAYATIAVPVGTGGESALSVVVVPTSLYAATTGSSATTSAATGTATGGTAPYNYVWTLISGDAFIVPVSPTTPATTFSASGLATGDVRSAVYRLAVTDSAAVSGLSGFLTVTVQNTAGGGTPGGPPVGPDTLIRVTEDGDERLTEDGETRVPE